MQTGEFLRRYRAAKGLSARSLATEIGVSFYRLQKWETSHYAPKLEDGEKIKQYFVLHDLGELSEELLKIRIESINWTYPKAKSKMGKKGKPAQEPNQKIIKELSEQVEEIGSMLVALKKKLNALKNHR